MVSDEKNGYLHFTQEEYIYIYDQVKQSDPTIWSFSYSENREGYWNSEKLWTSQIKMAK